MKIHCTDQFLRAAALLAVIIYGGNILAQAQSCSATWTGNAGNGSWSTASNWSPRKVPGPTSNVCIPTFTTADGAGLDGSSSSISVHSIQVAEGGSLLFGSGTVSIATSLTNQGFITLYGTTLSAASISLPGTGEIDSYDNSSITSPAFSNATGTVSVGAGGTLRLADNPVQLQNGNLSGGNWLVSSGVLIVPSDISQITSTANPYSTVVSLDGTGSAVHDASGHNALATLTSVGSTAVLALFDSASVAVAQALTNQGVIDVSGSLTISGTYTQASGAATNMGGSLSATSVIVQSGSTLGGNGTVESSVTDSGTVAPQGILTVTGNYVQTGGGALTEQFGSTLQVDLSATLSGALNVTVNPKHPPKSGQTYTALTFGSLSGSFTSFTAGYTLTTNANSIVVRKN
jgi:hypothetical protein